MNDKSIDIVVVGGGLTGATLMLALENIGYTTLLIEKIDPSKRTSPHFDTRTLALSPTSQGILERLQLWQHLKSAITPIDAIEASRQFQFGRTRLFKDCHGPLGYIVDMHSLNQVLFSHLAKEKLLTSATVTDYDKASNRLIVQKGSKTLTIIPQLIVAADGTKSPLRTLAGLNLITKDYQQDALVANIGLARAHGNCAFERFTSTGPLALLPLQDKRAALVWALAKKDAEEYLTCKETVFLSRLQEVFGYKLGKLVKVGERALYPLSQSIMKQSVAWPFVFVGNAAQTLHPVAGQGFNLGLRDIASLAHCIAKKGLNADMLKDYAAMRAHDQKTMAQFTDYLVQFFSNKLPGFGFLQSFGLITIDTIPFLQKILLRHARGFSGFLPDLVLKKGGYFHEAL